MSRHSPVRSRFLRQLAVAALFLVGAFTLDLGAAAANERKSFDVPRGEASDTLKRFAQQAGHQVVYPALEVRGVTTNAVKGSFTPQEGLDLLLAGTDLAARVDERTATIAVARKPDPNAGAARVRARSSGACKTSPPASISTTPA